MTTMRQLFGTDKALIGMVHVGALPGSPFARLGLDRIVDAAAAEARMLAGAGFDGIIIENMHDRPYMHGQHGPEVVAAMTRVGLAVAEAAGAARMGPGKGSPMPLGVQVLSGGNREAMAVALAIGAGFIRCENFVFAHVADEGLLPTAEAGSLLRYRRTIGADREGASIRIFTDVKKKHASHAITADVPIGEAAEAAAFFGSDGLIITGTATGKACDPADVLAAEAACPDLPILIGSGVTPGACRGLLEHADGLIVGSAIKQNGFWENPLDEARCREMVEAVAAARRG
jgi:membrane complex biogenesis BtpA family protein